MTHHLRAEGLTQAEVLQALREHGVEDLVGSKPPCWKSTAQSASCHGTHRAAAHDDASAAASTRPDWCALLRWLTLVIRQVPADDLGGRDAVQFGHEQVHQHDVGSKPMRHAHRLGGTRTLAPFRASGARRVTVLVDRTTHQRYSSAGVTAWTSIPSAVTDPRHTEQRDRAWCGGSTSLGLRALGEKAEKRTSIPYPQLAAQHRVRGGPQDLRLIDRT